MPTFEEGGAVRYSAEELGGVPTPPTPEEQAAHLARAEADYEAAIAAGPSVQLLHDDGRFYSYVTTDDETRHDPEWREHCRREAELASDPLSRDHPQGRQRRQAAALHAFDQRATLRRLRASRQGAGKSIPLHQPVRARQTRREAHGRPRQANAPPSEEGDQGDDDSPGDHHLAGFRRVGDLVHCSEPLARLLERLAEGGDGVPGGELPNGVGQFGLGGDAA